MSILLDALRKSEQRDKLGQIPNVHEPGPVHAEEPPSRRWLLIALLLIPVFVLLLWWLWQKWDGQGRQIAEPEYAQEQGSASPPDTSGQLTTAAGNEQKATNTVPANRQPRSPVETLNSAQPVRKPASEPASNPAITETPPEQPAAPKANARQAQAEPVQRPARQSPAAKEPVAGRSPPDMISYWQLPQDVRDQLPALKINVLVYAENGKDRFILMGGKRFSLGDEVTRGLRLTGIRPDRAVFRYRLYRFYVTQ